MPNTNLRCRAKRIPVDWLETAVWGDVEEFLRNPSETLDRARHALQAPEPTRDRRAVVAEIEVGVRASAAARERVLVTPTGEGKDRDVTIRVDFRFRDAVEMSTSRRAYSHGTD